MTIIPTVLWWSTSVHLAYLDSLGAVQLMLSSERDYNMESSRMCGPEGGNRNRNVGLPERKYVIKSFDIYFTRASSPALTWCPPGGISWTRLSTSRLMERLNTTWEGSWPTREEMEHVEMCEC